MKRVWKPLDVGGLRLYRVHSCYRNKQLRGKYREYIVAAKSPSHAADLMDAIYRPEDGYDNVGVALGVYQPAEWWENGIPCCQEASK